ncbi:MAG: zf-HC2 domain-containing protein [Acidimicrobiia bacterium]|nr:zf-HC2 domain-containing protein [Acidimicrobiia bacterium]
MGKQNCQDSLAHVYFYLDDEIGRLRKARIKRHLKKCPPCMGAFSFESRLKAIVRERVREEPQPEVMDRLRAFLKENESGFGN